MKAHIFIPLLCLFGVVSWAIWQFLLPDYIRLGGPLIIGLMMMSMIAVTFILERTFTLRRAQGAGDIAVFARKLRQAL